MAAEGFVFDVTVLTQGKNILEILVVITPGLRVCYSRYGLLYNTH
jgi:hypothetical protein